MEKETQPFGCPLLMHDAPSEARQCWKWRNLWLICCLYRWTCGSAAASRGYTSLFSLWPCCRTTHGRHWFDANTTFTTKDGGTNKKKVLVILSFGSEIDVCSSDHPLNWLLCRPCPCLTGNKHQSWWCFDQSFKILKTDALHKKSATHRFTSRRF